MLRAAVARSPLASDTPAALLTQSREYLTALSVDFVEDVSGPAKSTKTAPSFVEGIKTTKAVTTKVMSLLQAYKDIGDANKEPLLKYHNPRTFENLDKAIPNFRKFNLKAGEVPKFFDDVLRKRADESAKLKEDWWATRRHEAAVEGSGKGTFPGLPTPTWEYGKPVALSTLTATTDKLLAQLVPARKLKLPTFPAQVQDTLTTYATSLGQPEAVGEIKNTLLKLLAESAVVEEGGKVLPNFEYLTKSEVEKKLAAKRAEVTNRFVQLWAKRVLVTPEQALVPLKERDALLGSTFAATSPKYNDLISRVSFGSVPYGDRLASCAELDGFLLRRDKDKVKAEFPVTKQEEEAIALSKKLEDRTYALTALLGPTLHAPGASNKLPSQEVAELTEHLYTPDRYFYKEGVALAKKLAAQEQELKVALEAKYGHSVDLVSYLRSPPSPVAELFDALATAESGEAARAAARDAVKDKPYLLDALTKQQNLLKDPSNAPLDEVLYPSLTRELYEIELAELAAQEAQIDEAEEEELWYLTLLAQARHIHQHIEFDLPQAAIAHMDPILYKKLDWETTHGQDLLHLEVKDAADSDAGTFMKDMYSLENLSHHFLPLIRYRRKKYRKLHGFFPPEVSSVPTTAKAAP